MAVSCRALNIQVYGTTFKRRLAFPDTNAPTSQYYQRPDMDLSSRFFVFVFVLLTVLTFDRPEVAGAYRGRKYML